MSGADLKLHLLSSSSSSLLSSSQQTNGVNARGVPVGLSSDGSGKGNWKPSSSSVLVGGGRDGDDDDGGSSGLGGAGRGGLEWPCSSCRGVTIVVLRRQDVTTRALEMLSSVARTPALWRVFAGLVFFGVWFLLFTELEHRMRTIEETNQYMGKMLARLNSNRFSALGETSSQAEDIDDSLGLPLKTFDNQVIIYNRVPKTASTSFSGVAYDLCAKNRFFVLHINTSRNMHVMSVADQMRYSVNISQWEAMKPSIYHGHVAFVDFTRFGMPQPIYINIVREPLERLVSYYYFLRNGDDFRPHLQRRRSGDKRTFDECVLQQGQDCSEDKMWLQIPFFCGHAPSCWQPGNRWALEQAKNNLINKYLLVGTTEHLQDFVDILEIVLPRFFRGASKHFQSGNKSHLRKTSNKRPVSADTVALIKQWPIYDMEFEFYEFAKRHFNLIKEKLNGEQGAQQFFFEKIRPKKHW